MKYKLTVNEKIYEVEVENINTRPVIAYVDGQRFEVMPADVDQPKTRKDANREPENKPLDPNPPKGAAASNPAIHGRVLTAPLPGTVVEIFVKAGDHVEAGHVLLVIEAMKMKNSMRSAYSGKISEVLVGTGQSVSHKQVLIKFADQDGA